MDEQALLSDLRSKMAKVLEVLRTDLGTVRTGRAAPSLVENIVVSVYGNTTKMRVMEVATVAAQDNQTLLLTPFDNSIIGEIRKGIEDANVGLNPTIDSQFIRISIPPLSEERRKELIHLMRQKLENGKIMVRQVRHEGMDAIKKMESSEDTTSRLEKEVQKVTDETTLEIESMGKKKEEELTQI